MRIGLVTDFYYPWIGGPARLIRDLGHGLAARGHEVFLLAPSGTRSTFVESDGGVEVQRAATLPLPFGYQVRVAHRPLSTVARWLDAVQPDVVHTHHPFPVSAAAVWLAQKRNIPVLMTNHTIPECSLWGMRGLGLPYEVARAAFGRWLVGTLRRCDRVATPTKTAASALRTLGYRGEVLVISNGVDLDTFRPGPPNLGLRGRLGLDDRPIVLYTGRLDAEKQMDVWLRAAAASRVDAQFLVGGNGTERVRLQRLSVELGIDDRVRFMGYLADRDFPAVYRLADLYFITSPVELQSISTLEAIASGLPVIGVRAGALPELVRHGTNGYLAATGDWSEAGALLADLLVNGQKRAIMGTSSRSIALEHDLQRSIVAYERLLTDVAAKRGVQRRERTAAGEH